MGSHVDLTWTVLLAQYPIREFQTYTRRSGGTIATSQHSGAVVGHRSLIVGLCVAVLSLFTTGFLVFHGNEATASGSWDYILTHDDDYIYLSFARGFSQKPASNANPFYFEERGRTNSVLDYVVVAAVGLGAELLDIPVTYFIPPWKILAPFLLWVTLWTCLVHFWDVELRAAAAVSLALLISTFFMHGSAQFTLLRFPHPADGLWLTFLWASLVLHPQRLGKNHAYLMVGVGLGVVVVAPILAIFGMWLHLFSTLWSLWVSGREVARRLFFPLVALAGLCLCRALLVLGDLDTNNYLRFNLNVGDDVERIVDVGALVLFGMATIAVCISCRWQRVLLTTRDAALLGILAIEPIAGNVQAVLGNDHQIGTHRYYLLVLELGALVGWLHEKMPGVLKRMRGRGAYWLFGACIAIEAATLLHPDLNWFRHLPRTEPSHNIFDNDMLLLCLLPVLVLAVGVPMRFAGVARWLRSPAITGVLLSVLVLAAYGVRPSQIRMRNQDYPFGGAIGWLRQHAHVNEVLLSMPSLWTQIDYSLLYAPVKVYYNYLGSLASQETEDKDFRVSYYVALRDGLLSQASYGDLHGASQLSRHLRLDYVVVQAPGPWLDLVLTQLGEFASEVYRDERCVLLRVESTHGFDVEGG